MSPAIPINPIETETTPGSSGTGAVIPYAVAESMPSSAAQFLPVLALLYQTRVLSFLVGVYSTIPASVPVP